MLEGTLTEKAQESTAAAATAMEGKVRGSSAAERAQSPATATVPATAIRRLTLGRTKPSDPRGSKISGRPSASAAGRSQPKRTDNPRPAFSARPVVEARTLGLAEMAQEGQEVGEALENRGGGLAGLAGLAGMTGMARMARMAGMARM